jgi:hypothetical protein
VNKYKSLVIFFRCMKPPCSQNWEKRLALLGFPVSAKRRLRQRTASPEERV